MRAYQKVNATLIGTDGSRTKTETVLLTEHELGIFIDDRIVAKVKRGLTLSRAARAAAAATGGLLQNSPNRIMKMTGSSRWQNVWPMERNFMI